MKKLELIKTKELESEIKSKEFKGKKIITFGTFDLFHIGHKKIIDHALEIAGDEGNLIIAVSSDHWNKLKNKSSFQNQNERAKNIQKNYPNALVILEDHNKAEESWPSIWDKYNISLIVMGGDHFKNLSYINNKLTPAGSRMRISFFERTPTISSTLLRKNIENN